ncbi:MAG: 1-acyl-sn-glycerol-3-phosphate acyltransferase [Prevotellaceae bacterium]|jgi:1-acyl-sn-glycerol-3-phosphate acyltransferase|nr:1-acyl-sn-glycerol-3-phosphate acyltransferase [Prevotellaceae bacterium]
MESLFIEIYKYFVKYPKRRNYFLLFIILTCAVLASRVSFEEDISKMLRIDKETEELALLIEKTKSTEQLIMRIYAEDGHPDKDTLISIADTLTEIIKTQCDGLLSGIKSTVSQDDFMKTYSIIASNFPIFINPERYKDTLLIQPVELDSVLNGYLRAISTPGGILAREGLLRDPAGFTFEHLLQMKEMQTAFTVIDGYLFSKDEKNLIILMLPVNKHGETKNNTKLISVLDRITNDFNNNETGEYGYKNYKAQYFGAPRVAVGNSVQVRKDIYITLFVVLICILLLLISIFGKKRLPLLIVATVSFAGLFSLAAVGLFKSTISLIAIGSGAVILGIAVNYPIHFFTHYMHNRDVEKTIKSMVFPMTVGSLTTVGGFLCLTLTGSPLLTDFGLFGAFCLIGAALFSLVFLPHLFGKILEPRKINRTRNVFEKLSHYPLDKKPVLIGLIIVLTPVFLYFSFDVEYETDLSKLNYMSEEVQDVENQFNILSGAQKTILLVSRGKSPEEALSNSYKAYLLTDSLCRAGYECSYIGVAKAVPPRDIQRENIEKWNGYWKTSREDEKESIEKIFIKNGLNISLFDDFFSTLEGQAQTISEEDYQYLIDVFGNDYLYSDSTISTLVSHIVTLPENIPAITKIINKSPDTKVLNKQSITENLLSTVSNDFNTITFYTSLLVFLAILLSYGRIELTLITFIPMLISWVWILGIMGIAGIKFNIVNIILSTFIFGLGDDFCIFTTDACLKFYRKQENHTPVIRMSIIISGLTGLIGFGALLFAKHPAIYSLATVSVLGISSVLLISQTLQPFLFRILVLKPVSEGRPPISLLTVVNSLFFFNYFLLGSVLLSLSTLFIRILPVKNSKKKLCLHYLIHYMCRSLFALAVTVKKIKINPHGETFKTPAIIIANHQSMIDILQILALSPKIVFVVKDWVWKSPIMGLFVRFAGFHSISNGLDTVESYMNTIKAGYSIVIFPEGSRTNGLEIKRFHKGAFFLAEQLHVDILPIIIQNNCETLHKGSFCVYPNQITLKICERIAPENHSFGCGYKERTKVVSAFYRREYIRLGEEVSNPRYCVRKLRDAFMYKSPVLEWYIRIKLKIEDGYESFHKLVPLKGKIIDAGCGYGFLSYVLSVKSADREILGLDYDKAKIDEAANCYIKTPKVNFRYADITKYDFERADCFIFSDVLHYIKTDEIENIAQQLSEKLLSGGVVIIRDADTKEHRFNKISEFLSTKIFKFNKTEGELSFFTTEDICRIFEKYGFEYKIVNNDGRANFAINTYWILKAKDV